MVRSVSLFCEGNIVEIEHLAEFPEIFQNQESIQPESVIQSIPSPTYEFEPNRPVAKAGADSVFRRVEEKNNAEGGLALGDMKRKLEFEAIADAVRKTGGNITRAAKLLKMKRPRLSQIVNADPELKAINEKSRIGH